MNKSRVKWFADSKEAGKHLLNIIKEKDVILLKGSQSIRMEYAVEQIMAHPEDKKELLVRQDDEWAGR
jgi:UDP-N-acetylmuramyl pentapeptide synthase